MDEAKLAFLFGSVPEDADLSNPDVIVDLLLADRPERGTPLTVRLLRMAITDQILQIVGTDPAGTWATAKRLLDGGTARHEVMDLLVEAAFPLVDQSFEAYVEAVRTHEGLPVAEVAGLVRTELGLDEADPLSAYLVDAAQRDLADDPTAPVAVLEPGVLVHVPTLVAGVVLTHRVTAEELDEEHLDLDADLAGFLRVADPHVAAGPLHVDEEPPRWGGPEGWLEGLAAGALLEVRVAPDGAVTLAVLDAEPAIDAELVTAVRAAYDREHTELSPPVDAERLLLALLHGGVAFDRPHPPLSALAAAAGLEQRGAEFGHDPQVWADAADLDRVDRLAQRLDEQQVITAMTVLGLLVDQTPDAAVLRAALDMLRDPDVLSDVTEELLHDEEQVGAVVALAARMLGVAGSSARTAPARWIAAIAAERDGRVLDAESHLRAAAIAADGLGLVEDRLAWYESDRGHAAAAVGRWRSIDVPEDDPDLAAAQRFAAAAAPEPGRNDPCWCGSGRKYKHCHVGSPALPPLAERFGWLYRKASAYLERRGGAAEWTIADYADAMALDDEDVAELVDDPLLTDVALHEGGWFARFVADRGPLLPADEAALAASWIPVERTVYEVTGIRFGKGLRLTDLRTGAEIEVADPAAARTGTPGELLCARAVPDGADGLRFAGAVVSAPQARESELLDLLAEHDGPELLAWLTDAGV